MDYTYPGIISITKIAGMAASVSLTTQTLYAELIDRCAVAAFDAEFPLNGSFVRVRVKDRHYWYFQQGARDASGKQPRKYVGPDNDEIRQRMASHGRAKDDYQERRRLISLLRRSGFHSPPEETGRILKVLSDAGVFRMRACLVGTAAYQVYGPMLGIRLPRSSLQTQDLDIAQFTAISVAIGKDEQTPPLLEVLQQADPSFRSVPHMRKAEATVAYVNDKGFRVEILTENRGPERETPAALPAISTHAQPLRFMDFLIHDEIQAAVLYDAGILVNVPSPERYALHKLIITQRRRANPAKIKKDVEQSQALLGALAAHKAVTLRQVWNEAFHRGPKWQSHLAIGLGMIETKVRDRVLYVVGAVRSMIPGVDIHFADAPPRYDVDRHAITFPAEDNNGERVICAISREALHDHFGTGKTNDERIEIFRRHRQEIERMAREIYLHRRLTPDGTVLIKTADVPDLGQRSAPRAKKGARKIQSRRKPVLR
jgi:hypothetical protein